MEHTKKMILIEPREFEKINNVQKNQPDTLSHLDHEMQLVLNKKNMNDNEKWEMYNQILQRYLNILNHSRNPVSISLTYDKNEKLLTDKREKEEENLFDNTQDILKALPKQYINKGSLLVKKLKDNGVTWNDKGVVSYGNLKIENSNITDLIYDLMKSNKSGSDPVGWQHFADIIREINIPRVLIANQKRLHYINNNNRIKDEKLKVIADKEIEGEEMHGNKAEATNIGKIVSSSRPSTPLSSSTRKIKRKRKIDWSPYP